MFRPGNIPIFIRSIIVPSRQERVGFFLRSGHVLIPKLQTDEPQTQTVQLLTADTRSNSFNTRSNQENCNKNQTWSKN